MRRKLTALLLSGALCIGGLVACSGGEAAARTEYTIDATLGADHVLTASVTCDYVNNTDVPLEELWFHLYPNAYREGAKVSPIPSARIAEAYPSGRSYSKLEISSVAVDGAAIETVIAGSDEDILTVALGRKLEPTERVSVKIDYSVKLPKVKHRFGYTDKSTNLGNFYPIACMYRDGAFVADPYYSTGDPFFSDTANYNVKLTVPEDHVGAFTGSVRDETTADGNKTYTVTADNVRDFAAVFGKYEKMSGIAGSTIVNYYYYSDSAPETALNTAIAAVNTFSSLFGDYAYPEYSVVQTSFLNGGMEYPCLSMISDGVSGDTYNDVIVHETAHQWWYAAVGNDEVKHAWLDEGLAEYSTMMFYEKNTEGYKYTFNGKRADALTAYTLYCETYKDNGRGDTSMTRPVNEYANETEYSYMTYVKGALMLDDIRNSIGTAAFESALKTYYKDHKYGIAEPQDLIGAMEKASKRSLSGVFTAWLDGNVKLYVTD